MDISHGLAVDVLTSQSGQQLRLPEATARDIRSTWSLSLPSIKPSLGPSPKTRSTIEAHKEIETLGID